ncbi:MAG TPA: metal ABC transporter ATP-binding protein [Aquamicrobium sp.]|nr:metal ABC transporter ATP-binding protein [Aquamicrobium sp.]
MQDFSDRSGRTRAGAAAEHSRADAVPAARTHGREDILVSLDGVGVRRSGRWLVRGVSFDVRAGEIVTLIGPNGSGKSTTARALAGILRPDEGAVSRRASLRIGYVPQKLSIDRTLPLTVERLMTLTARHGRAEIAAALEEVGIGHLARAQVQSLSGGEFQRALLARAMLRRPELLVLDEPVQGVDYTGEAALYELIGRIRDRTGCGVLLISHDLHIVMAATDTVICLNGHVCCRGTPRAVASDPKYRQLFGQRAAGALAVYSHRHDHTHLADGRVLHEDGTITDHCHEGDGHHHGPHNGNGGGHAHGEARKETGDAR